MNVSAQSAHPARGLLARAAVTFACLSALTVAPFAQADTLDTIAKSGVVRIGVFEDYPPFGSIGPDMQPQGYDIDMATLIGKALNAKVELVQVTGDNRMAYLADHKADMLLSVGQTPERAKVIDFSQAYAPYYLAVFGPKSLAVKSSADLAGKTIAVARGTLEDLSVTKVAPAGATLKRFDDPNGAISAFLSGQAQLLVVGNDVGATIIARHPSIDPEQKFSLFSSPDHVGLNKNEPRLMQKVNDAISGAKKNGTLNTISQKWLRTPLPTDL
ncbi:ABC-type amino acid transport/signal transduction systems, periplasmic component/domain [Paraburkholderia unamae]|uniref:transporter substrate-binding domain-containing protein n=1 Tax=Paraburkholderia unamae TaxID=219649 RepID=UPI001CB344EA|nr:transporter substrate-binding domain-containing protein [Paraburkholderia unamae]CAG9268464.1 ABC-type amino acid transport/signal transduction systems, periplasmic component/domain [Paraburkholderia unamae]